VLEIVDDEILDVFVDDTKIVEDLSLLADGELGITDDFLEKLDVQFVARAIDKGVGEVGTAAGEDQNQENQGGACQSETEESARNDLESVNACVVHGSFLRFEKFPVRRQTGSVPYRRA